MKLKTLLILISMWVPVAFASNGPAAARVNGEEISEFRLERYFAEYLEDQGRALGSIRNPKAYKQLRQKALDALIDREVLWQEALKRGVVISDATVQRQVEQTRQAIGGAEKFARRLEDSGFDEAGFAEYTRRELAAQQVFADPSERAGRKAGPRVLRRTPCRNDSARRSAGAAHPDQSPSGRRYHHSRSGAATLSGDASENQPGRRLCRRGTDRVRGCFRKPRRKPGLFSSWAYAA
jgi:hypothetical protein